VLRDRGEEGLAACRPRCGQVEAGQALEAMVEQLDRVHPGQPEQSLATPRLSEQVSIDEP
jgi:hypothetical protein